MIYDKTENIELYFKEKSPLYKALKFAINFDSSQPDGRYEIEGDDIFALVSSYETKDLNELKFEAHKKYIDIQLLLQGSEFIDISFNKNLVVDKAYSKENDVALFKQPKLFTSLLIEPGMFAVLYPHDIHQPCRKVESNNSVRKMVIKVRV